jgi:DNA mismatch repair ATPase MutL
VKIQKLLDTLPARLAKMKKHPIPHAKIKSLMIAYALVNDVRFCFQIRGNRRADWCLPNACDAMGVAISAFGKEMDPYTLRKWASEGMTVESILPNRDESTSNLGPC